MPPTFTLVLTSEDAKILADCINADLNRIVAGRFDERESRLKNPSETSKECKALTRIFQDLTQMTPLPKK